MSQGILTYAFDTNTIKYGKIANICALLVRRHLGEKISIVKDRKTEIDTTLFDHVIEVDSVDSGNVEWRNKERHNYFEMTPYDKTLVIDSDYLLFNNRLGLFFNTKYDLVLSYNARQPDLTQMYTNERRLNSFTLDMCWATCFYFNKNDYTKAFFDLTEMVRDNYSHYAPLYGVNSSQYRNDYVFSIAHHLFSNQGPRVGLTNPFPITTAYREYEILNVFEDGLLLYNPTKEIKLDRTTNESIHVLNKHTLLENYDKFERLFF